MKIIFVRILFILFISKITYAENPEVSQATILRNWPFRIFKVSEHQLMKNSEEVCLFIDCSCQNPNRLTAKLNSINCTQTIGVSSSNLQFPSRIDTENFIDFDQQIEHFLFRQNKFNQIPDRTFNNLRITFLEIDNNDLELINSNVFTGIKQLNRILLTNERGLKVIQTDAFVPLKYLLLELDLSYNDIDDSRMDKFSIEISKLYNLQQLTINNNMLTSVKQSWFKGLTNLDVLNLNANFLKVIEPSAFQELVSLKRISLANNLFSGHLNQTPFESVKTSLVRIDLSHNEITKLPELGYLDKLRYLDLSHNLIENIDPVIFRFLFSLYSLDLSTNNISFIDKDAFLNLENLFYLRLGDNKLNEVPNVQTLTSLVVLDLKNQNGNLDKLSNFQFERKGRPKLAMEVNIEQNDLSSFQKRVFCSNNYNDSLLDSLTISFRTLASIIDLNHCILTQLTFESSEFRRREWSQLNIADSDKQNISRQFIEKNYCNCDLLVFFENIRVNLTGIPFDNCPLMTDYWKYNTSIETTHTCFNHTFIDTCSHQVNYNCHYVPVTRPARPTTKLIDYGIYYEKSGQSMLKSGSLYFFIISVFQVMWKIEQ